MRNGSLLVIGAPTTLEFVENAIVLVEHAQLVAQVVVHRVGLDRPTLHVEVPDLDVQVVARAHVAARVAELDVRDAADDLGEEVLRGWVLPLFENLKKADLCRIDNPIWMRPSSYSWPGCRTEPTAACRTGG